MSLSETSKLLAESRQIVDSADSTTDASVILTMILKLVTSIDNRLQKVENCLGKFEEMKNFMNSLNNRMITTEKTVTECRSKVNELENNIEGISNLFDNIKVECAKNKAEIKKTSEIIGSEINSMKEQSNTCNCQEAVRDLHESVLDLQARSMRNNLIFSGLHEVREENTEILLRDFLEKEIGIDYRIEFGNVHRFGKGPRGRRPIVARFLYFYDLQYVLNNAYRLKGTPYSIHQQFPKEIEDRRKKLYPAQKAAKRAGKKVVMVRDRLFINNVQHIPPSDEDISGISRSSNEYATAVMRTPVHNHLNNRPQKRQRIYSTTPPRGQY